MFNNKRMRAENILGVKGRQRISLFVSFSFESWHKQKRRQTKLFDSIYRWTVDGRAITAESGPNYRLVEGNLLINNPHVVNHRGVYQCIATNTFGTIVSREAKVQFACKLTFFAS